MGCLFFGVEVVYIAGLLSTKSGVRERFDVCLVSPVGSCKRARNPNFVSFVPSSRGNLQTISNSTAIPNMMLDSNL